MWKLGLRPRYSFSGNIWFEILVFCLFSVRTCEQKLNGPGSKVVFFALLQYYHENLGASPVTKTIFRILCGFTAPLWILLISEVFWAESGVCLGASAKAPFLHICDSYPIDVSHLSFNFLCLLLHISVGGHLIFSVLEGGGGGSYSSISTEPEFVNV